MDIMTFTNKLKPISSHRYEGTVLKVREYQRARDKAQDSKRCSAD